jgi:hypothetical protein
MTAKDHAPYGQDRKHNGSSEFLEDAAAAPSDLEGLNVDEKALVRKV